MKPDLLIIFQFLFERFLTFAIWVGVAMGMIAVVLIRRGLRRLDSDIKNYRKKKKILVYK